MKPRTCNINNPDESKGSLDLEVETISNNSKETGEREKEEKR